MEAGLCPAYRSEAPKPHPITPTAIARQDPVPEILYPPHQIRFGANFLVSQDRTWIVGDHAHHAM